MTKKNYPKYVRFERARRDDIESYHWWVYVLTYLIIVFPYVAYAYL